jgi:hypothetical protein
VRIIDVLNAQSQLFQTKRDLAQARYNVLLGRLRLHTGSKRGGFAAGQWAAGALNPSLDAGCPPHDLLHKDRRPAFRHSLLHGNG